MEWGLPVDLVWGVFPRLVGLVFLVSFISLFPQVVLLAGRRGCVPFQLRLQGYRKAFPAWRRWLHFPTLLWLNDSDRMLRALVLAGVASALCVIYGGPLGSWGMLGCYLVYVSLDKPIGLIFPWDSVLFELGFLCLLLPGWSALPSLSAPTPPAALVWALRLLPLRVFLGFGKTKFIGSSRADAAYLYGFLINQPLPSPLAWHLQKLPVWTLKVALAIMFLVEIPVPLLVFHAELGVLAGVVFMLFMMAIWACGTFGYFSLVMMVASVPLFDPVSAGLPLAESLLDPSQLLTNAVVALHLLGALLAFPFNSWVGQHWHHWVALERLPRAVRATFGLYRFLHALRFVHPYGVFPPKSQPAAKIVPVVEVSWDGEHWVELEFPLACSHPYSKPRYIAPHHARGDQALIYEAFGLNSQSLVNGLTLPGDPLIFTHHAGAQALLQMVLEGRAPTGVYLKESRALRERPPPALARMRTLLLVPTTLDEKRRTGAWWRRAYIGPHLPPTKRIEGFWDDWFPEPELFHCELLHWRRRSYLQQLTRRAARGESTRSALIADAPELSADAVERFWCDFLPFVRVEDRADWSTLPRVRAALQSRYSRQQLRAFERILGRLCVIAAAHVDPLYLTRRTRLPVKNYGRLWFAIHSVIWDGEAAFERLRRDPEWLRERLAASSLEHDLYLSALFRYDAMVFEASKLRLIESFVNAYRSGSRTEAEARREAKQQRAAESLTVFAELSPFLRRQLRGSAFDHGLPERYPRFVQGMKGEVKLDEHSVESWEAPPGKAGSPASSGAGANGGTSSSVLGSDNARSALTS
jgi:hypothetical protein